MKPPSDKKPARSKASSRAYDFSPVYGGIEKRRMSPEAFEKFKRESLQTAESPTLPAEALPPETIPESPPPVVAEEPVLPVEEPINVELVEDSPPVQPDTVEPEEDPPPPPVADEPEPLVIPSEEISLEAFRLVVNLPANRRLFGNFVRGRLGVTQTAAAEALGYPGRGGFNNNLNGQAPWRLDRLERVLAYIGTDATQAWLALQDQLSES